MNKGLARIGLPLVHGVPSLKNIAGIPPGVKIRVRMRESDYVRVFLKFADKIEQWLVHDRGQFWELSVKQAANARVHA